MIESDKLDKTKIYWVIEDDGARKFYINGGQYYLECWGFKEQIIPLLEALMMGDGKNQCETIICPKCGEIAWNSGVEENKYKTHCWCVNYGKLCNAPIKYRPSGIIFDSKLIMMITEKDKLNSNCIKETNWAKEHYVKIEVYEDD